MTYLHFLHSSSQLSDLDRPSPKVRNAEEAWTEVRYGKDDNVLNRVLANHLEDFLKFSRLTEGDNGSASTATVPDSGSTRMVTPSSHSEDSGVSSDSSVSVPVEVLLSRLERTVGTFSESY